MRHETAIFEQKPKSRNSSYFFCCAYSLLIEQQKHNKVAETPNL